MTAEFVLDLDEGMLEYFREMVDVLVDGDTAPGQATGGWYGDDLLYAVVTLVGLSRHLRDEVECFLTSLSGETRWWQG
ncbi:hypothetical protein PEM37_02925 [Streptomyces sp. AD681]|uniref:hypothetical protein n=1 Tax=Streptomyces sp. AD681 TaxID=3019069 RepID=UPI0022F1D36B|nr:hypothetical protein [Streptomyces sp. AD681]MDA5140442.1 hypothetical protein [Streptomyces sp. AD681]